MNILRTLRLFLLLTAISCISISCNKHATASGSGSKVVGFSQEGEESDWRTAESQSIKSEAQNRHIDLRFADAQEDHQIDGSPTGTVAGPDVFEPVVRHGDRPQDVDDHLGADRRRRYGRRAGQADEDQFHISRRTCCTGWR